MTTSNQIFSGEVVYFDPIKIGPGAGKMQQEENSVSIGIGAGYVNQHNSAVAIGPAAGGIDQGISAIAIGDQAGSGEHAQTLFGTIHNNILTAMSPTTEFSVGMKLFVGIRDVNSEIVERLSDDEAGNHRYRITPTDDLVSGSVVIGKSGNQSANSIAVGKASGSSFQGSSSIAIGMQAGKFAQGNYAVTVGQDSGKILQGESSIAIGKSAGEGSIVQTDRGTITGNIFTAVTPDGEFIPGMKLYASNAVYLETDIIERLPDNEDGSHLYAVTPVDDVIIPTAIKGIIGQGADAVAIGLTAGQTSQGGSAVAIGSGAGATNQSASATAVGAGAGQSTQGIDAIAIGTNAGAVTQGDSSVAVGVNSGQNTQGIAAVSVGYAAGQDAQGARGVAIGDFAANDTQGIDAIAIGSGAATSVQSDNAVAIGTNAGQTSQGVNAVAIGNQAGKINQSDSAVALGTAAGGINQSAGAISIGKQSSYFFQQSNAVSIGSLAGINYQGANSIAIGTQAAPGVTASSVSCTIVSNVLIVPSPVGVFLPNMRLFNINNVDLGTNIISRIADDAFGSQRFSVTPVADLLVSATVTGVLGQAPNTIVLNASGVSLDTIAAQTNSLYVSPIRQASSNSNTLTYNSSTKEITVGFPKLPSYADDVTVNAAITAAGLTLAEGMMYVDNTLHKVKVYLNNAWVALSP